MDVIHIQGGIALGGTVKIQGSKNAALPILAATLLTEEPSFLYNCPRITDVYGMISLLRSLGCRVKWTNGGVRVETADFYCGNLPAEAITGMRSSICLLGALLGKCGEVVMERPGGCVIGERPIDLHINALTAMGVEFREEADRILASTEGLHGAEITLPMVSVGATENVVLAAVLAEGDTDLWGAAREPEVVALCRYLESCGAQIEGIGTSRLKIRGGRTLYGTEFSIPADRIVAGTYLLGCVGTGGNVFLEDAPWQSMEATLEAAECMGAKCICGAEGIYVQASARPRAIPYLKTEVYPGFPTDLQSAALAVLSRADGDSVVEESIFENRFRVREPLTAMGARISLPKDRKVKVSGRENLQAAQVRSMELRGGAALVLAGLMAEGETEVVNCQYIHRGYENICRDLRELGARITGV